MELLPAFTDVVFESGVERLALMTSTLGLGSTAAALWIVSFPKGRALTRSMLIAGMTGTVAVVLFTQTNSFHLAIPLLFVIGFSWTTAGVLTQTLIQLGVDDEVGDAFCRFLFSSVDPAQQWAHF